jgi:hypothetical protein
MHVVMCVTSWPFGDKSVPVIFKQQTVTLVDPHILVCYCRCLRPTVLLFRQTNRWKVSAGMRSSALQGRRAVYFEVRRLPLHGVWLGMHRGGSASTFPASFRAHL